MQRFIFTKTNLDGLLTLKDLLINTCLLSVHFLSAKNERKNCRGIVDFVLFRTLH